TVSKTALNRALILGCFVLVIAAAFVSLRVSKRCRLAALGSADLDLKHLKPKPPVANDCSDVDRMLGQLRPPKKGIDKRPPQDRTELTSDEMAIYRAVLQRWVAGDQDPMNVSTKTYHSTSFPKHPRANA